MYGIGLSSAIGSEIILSSIVQLAYKLHVFVFVTIKYVYETHSESPLKTDPDHQDNLTSIKTGFHYTYLKFT